MFARRVSPKEEKKERRPDVGQYQTTMGKREYELRRLIAVGVEKYAFIQSNQIVSSNRRSRGPLVRTLPNNSGQRTDSDQPSF